MTNLEGMAFSIPVICGEDNGTACYIRQGKTGFQHIPPIIRRGNHRNFLHCLPAFFSPLQFHDTLHAPVIRVELEMFLYMLISIPAHLL